MTAPALAIDAGETIGRLYRRPQTPMPTQVRFDADGRPTLTRRDAETLVVDGTLVPSITNVLGVRATPHLIGWSARKAADAAMETFARWPERIASHPSQAREYIRGAADRDRDAAALRGDRVHLACEAEARGEAITFSLTADEQACVDAWKSWLDRWQPEFLGLEVTVFGQTDSGLPYAGTGDVVFRAEGITFAGDYKTTRSGLHKDVALQLSAVAHAQSMTTDNETLTNMITVDAGVGIHLSPEGFQIKPVVLDGESWDNFGHLRGLWDMHVMDGRLRSGQKTLGPSVANPLAALAYSPRAHIAAAAA